MDDETRTQFAEVKAALNAVDQRFAGVDERIASMDARMMAMENRIVTLIENLADSLKNEMHELKGEIGHVRTEMRDRSDRMEARMDRIGGLVNGGSRAIARLAEWTEKSDQFAGETLRRLNDLEQRMAKIESKNRNN